MTDDKKKPTSAVPRAADVITPSAREIAKHVDRRQMRRKILLVILLIATVALALTYMTCGKGWGIGGRGKGDGDGPGSVKALATVDDAGVEQCEIKLSPEGITVAGVKTTRNDAVAACKTAGRAVVIVTGDTVQADWDDLKAALEAAKVEVFRREGATGSRSGSAR